MGCGASSSKGGVPSEPAPKDAKGTGTPPTPSKNPSGKKLPPLYEQTASLGRRSVNDSFRVSSDRRSKQFQEPLPPISESPATANGSSRSGSQNRPASGKASAAPQPAPAPPGTPPPRPPPAQASSQGKLQPPTDVSTRPAMQLPKLAPGPMSCLAPTAQQQQQQSAPGSPSGMPEGMQMHIQHMAGGGGSPAGQCAAAAQVRQLLCRTRPPIQALLDAGAASALVRCLKEGPPDAKLEAAWALANIAASPNYSHVEALCNVDAPAALVALLAQLRRPGSGSRGGQAAAASAALQEQVLWALGNIAGAMHPDLRTQALATEVLDAGALALVLSIIESEAARGDGSTSPLLRCAVWCLHNLAKHKREKDMVNAIPLATRLLLESSDLEVLTCCAWVLAYLGSNEDNKSHLKQALPALPRLAPWVREASSSLATPSLLCLGTMCTGYMRSLDYSGDVVDAGGVPAMLSYLRTASQGGRRDMVKEALFALSNVAGANNATVKAMLDAGAFSDVISLMHNAGEDEEVRVECLYVLTNPWDPLVGTEVATVKQLMDCGILTELHNLLDPGAPALRLGLLLKGLADGLKRGQQLMTYAATMMLVELGREAAASAPPPANPVVQLYTSLGTVDRIQSLNSHPDEEVATRANGILTVLKFM